MSWSWNNLHEKWVHHTGLVSANPKEQMPEEPRRTQKITDFKDSYWPYLVRGLEGLIEMILDASQLQTPSETMKKRIQIVIDKLKRIIG